MNVRLIAPTMGAVVIGAVSNLACAAAPALEELIVTASPLGDVLQPSSVLDGDALLLKTAPTLGETLANELGVSSSYFGPAASRPVIRGLSGSRVKMLSNSVSSLDVSDVSPDHAVAIEPLLADKIEIIRGPATLLYGSSAAGGVVNVIDTRIPDAPAESALSGGIQVRGDTAAEERAIVGRLDGGGGAFAWHLEGFDRETDDIEIPGFATTDPAERSADEIRNVLANSYSESDGVSAGASWVGNNGYLGASISQLSQVYGLPGPEAEEGGDGDPEIFDGPFLDMEETRVDVRGKYRFDSGAWESLGFSLGNNDYEHNEIEPTGEVATRFRNDAWQLRVEAVHAPLSGWRGALGMQLDDRDFSAVGEEAFVTQTATEAMGLFLLEEREIGSVHLHLGARAEFLEHGNVTLPDYDDTAWSFGAGIGIDVVADSEVFADLSYTERHPSPEELYSDGAHIATRQYEIGLLAIPGGDAGLEKSANLEIGWRREQGAVRWETSAYFYAIEDYVFQSLTGALLDELPVAEYRQQDAEFYGLEASVTLPLLSVGDWESDVRLFGDYVRAELSDGSDLPRIPPWRAGANVTVGRDAWKSGLDIIYYAKQNDINSFSTDAYTMVDLSIMHRLDVGSFDWELFVKGSNLLDEEARKSTSFLAAYAPLPGRSLHVGATMRF